MIPHVRLPWITELGSLVSPRAVGHGRSKFDAKRYDSKIGSTPAAFVPEDLLVVPPWHSRAQNKNANTMETRELHVCLLCLVCLGRFNLLSLSVNRIKLWPLAVHTRNGAGQNLQLLSSIVAPRHGSQCLPIDPWVPKLSLQALWSATSWDHSGRNQSHGLDHDRPPGNFHRISIWVKKINGKQYETKRKRMKDKKHQ